MYSLPLVLFTLAVGIAYALPPFEIRSAGSQKSEAALEWIQHLHRQKACPASAGSSQFVCPSSPSYQAKCVSWEQLCDGNSDCPRDEDENTTMCYFLEAKAKSQRYGHF
jgi:hypothetical protein